MLELVVYYELPKMWTEVAPLLRKAYDRGFGDYTMESIYERIANQDYQLWVWRENGKVIVAAVTCIVIYPCRKICSIMMVGGRGFKLWHEDGLETIRQWGRQNDCSHVEGYDTRGWVRALKNWRPLWTVIRQEI